MLNQRNKLGSVMLMSGFPRVRNVEFRLKVEADVVAKGVTTAKAEVAKRKAASAIKRGVRKLNFMFAFVFWFDFE